MGTYLHQLLTTLFALVSGQDTSCCTDSPANTKQDFVVNSWVFTAWTKATIDEDPGFVPTQNFAKPGILASLAVTELRTYQNFDKFDTFLKRMLLTCQGIIITFKETVNMYSLRRRLSFHDMKAIPKMYRSKPIRVSVSAKEEASASTAVWRHSLAMKQPENREYWLLACGSYLPGEL